MNKIKLKKKKLARPVTVDQWIEVTHENGVTTSTYYPPNDELEKYRLDMDPAPSLVYRRINFINGIPHEYDWTQPDEDVRLYGGHFLHRVLIEEWPQVMQDEREFGGGHVVPAANPQPRPEALGPCPCRRCTAERESPQAA